MKNIFFAALGLVLMAVPSRAENPPKTYTDSRGNPVYFPLGDISFADELVDFKEGKPHADDKRWRDPNQVLKPPNANKSGTKVLTLGCGGSIVVKFTDNALIDVEGPDLYVFETGPAIEPTALAISKDGKNWIKVGEISGGTAQVDISSSVQPMDFFYYVRLTDLKKACKGRSPGADIDAVGAIGSAMVLALNSAVLFDVNKYELKPSAVTELDGVVEKLKALERIQILVEGHTDNTGTPAANQTLSQNRARSVKDYLASRLGLDSHRIASKGYGETRPVDTNDTEEGRQNNRRVAILVMSAR